MSDLPQGLPELPKARRFISTKGFRDGTSHIEVSGSKVTIVSETGNRQSTCIFSIDELEGYVMKGLMYEAAPADDAGETIKYASAWKNIPDGWGYYWVNKGDDVYRMMCVQPGKEYKNDSRSVEAWMCPGETRYRLDSQKMPKWKWLGIPSASQLEVALIAADRRGK